MKKLWLQTNFISSECYAPHRVFFPIKFIKIIKSLDKILLEMQTKIFSWSQTKHLANNNRYI